MKRNSKLASRFLLLALLACSMSCARRPDDAKMSSDIQSKFSQDSGLSSKQLTVQASNGVVTLSGSVDNQAQRDAAARQAASVEGVKTVINNLQVGMASAMTPSTSAEAPAPAAMKHSAGPAPDKAADNSKPASGKKSSKPRADDSSQAGGSNADPNAGQVTASNQGTPPAQNDPPAPAPDDTPVAQTPPPPPSPKKMIIDQGTQITVRLIDPIDSEKNQTGDTFHATLNTPLTSDGEQAVPAGVELTGHLVEVKSAGKFAGQSSVSMQLDSINSGGQTYNLQTDQYKKTGNSRGKNTAEKVGGGAILGGIIGAIAGGGKGAAIGTAAGAGVGGGVQASGKSQQIKLPSETVLTFTLQAPITVVQSSAPDASRQKLGDSQ